MKSHVHQLICSALLLFLLCCAYGCAAAVVNLKSEDGWEPIRIGVYPGGLSVWIKSCRRYSTNKVSFGSFATVTYEKLIICDPVTGITPEKAKMMHKVVVEGSRLHMDRLLVKPVKGNLLIEKHHGYDFKERCPDAFPRRDHLTKGIPKVDFALYLGLTASHEEHRICSKDANGRPTSGLIKLNPKEFNNTRHYIRLAAHEIGHALGFTLEEFKENDMLLEEKSNTGRNIMALLTDTVKKKAQDHYNCKSLNHMELDYRSGKNEYPHWKRRHAKDELMSTYVNRPSAMYYTELTLAAFHSLPYYKADFSKAETMTWGRNASCEFLTGKCVEDSTPKFPEMFCNDSTTVLRCTTDRASLGTCSMKQLASDVPREFQYFTNKRIGSPSSDMMDHCPVIESSWKTSCEFGDEDAMPGSIVSNMSRCLEGEFLEPREPKYIGTFRDICANVKCENGILKVQYKGNEKWHECTDGKRIDIEKGPALYGGKIVCPKYSDFCTDKPEESQ
ncbi:surface protease GP63 [Trypanosoma theileri]|uniref:Leishmanolysin-like peptidase n=1 Tax=Trypanosoma theileri TaxID=67003 RepID=A0A1X0P8B4_9TRYP|nr:surface protease GP63 [Trypanosoma theileri]ORC93075.1 surface protease GP63 [Trypanosoma theileri]